MGHPHAATALGNTSTSCEASRARGRPRWPGNATCPARAPWPQPQSHSGCVELGPRCGCSVALLQHSLGAAPPRQPQVARPCPPLRGPRTAGRGPAPPGYGRGLGPQGSSSGKPGGDCRESGGAAHRRSGTATASTGVFNPAERGAQGPGQGRGREARWELSGLGSCVAGAAVEALRCAGGCWRGCRAR